MMGLNVFIYSKPLLFRFKGSPRGVKPLVISYLYVNLLLIIFLDIIITFFFSLVYRFDITIVIIMFFLFLLNCISILLQAIGIQCSIPLFEERAKNAYLISYIILFIQFFFLLLTLYIFIPIMPNAMEFSTGFLYILIFHIIFILSVSILLFLYGLKHLNNVE